MQKIRKYLKANEKEMLLLLERLVSVDSGSFHKDGIDDCGRIVGDELKTLDFDVEVVVEKEYGNHIMARRAGTGERRLFLLAHLDTVFPLGAVAKRPFRVEDNFAYGPGVGDIKGGIVQMLYALKALRALGRDTPPIYVFLTGDEEIGSVKGRPYIEDLATKSSWVLVMEPASAHDSIGIRRWGLGAFYLTIYGKAAHVLKPDSDGINACRELALKILALESLTDTHRGIRVSVNLVKGGRSRQVTASEAYADIDVRVRDSVLMEQIQTQVEKLAGTPILPGIRVELRGAMTRPPLEPNSASDALLRIASEVAADIGINVIPIEEYGGSDGCFTAALGVATLDGMGPHCYDMCGDDERIDVRSLVPRTALIAGIIAQLAKQS